MHVNLHKDHSLCVRKSGPEIMHTSPYPKMWIGDSFTLIIMHFVKCQMNQTSRKHMGPMGLQIISKFSVQFFVNKVLTAENNETGSYSQMVSTKGISQLRTPASGCRSDIDAKTSLAMLLCFAVCCRRAPYHNSTALSTKWPIFWGKGYCATSLVHILVKLQPFRANISLTYEYFC